HVASPSQIAQWAEEHPARERIEQLPQVIAGKKSKQYQAFSGGVALFEASMQMRWQEVLDAVSANGLTVGLDPDTDGVALLSRGDSGVVSKLFQTLASTAKVLGNQNAEIDQSEYLNYPVLAINQVKVAQLDDWIVVTNKPQLGKQIVDRYHAIANGSTAPGSRLGDVENYRLAKQSHSSSNNWLFMDIERIRQSGAAPELYSGRTENILAEALVGGLFSVLQETPYATAKLKFDETAIDLSVTLPTQPEWLQSRAYSFAGGDHTAPTHLDAKNRLASFTAYRDLSEMWLRAGDYLTDKAADELAVADATLSTFFAGRDFGVDILGAFEPGVQLIASRQAFPSSSPQPAIKLPQFALQFTMKNPDFMRGEMRRVFISLFGFLNVIGAMEKQPQLDFAMETFEGDVELISTYYLPPSQDETLPGRSFAEAPINYNFTPTIAFRDDKLIVSSTRQLATELATTPNEQSSGSAVNAQLVLNTEVGREILEDNRNQLVTQNMLENGHSSEAAEAEIGLLLSLVELFRESSLTVEAPHKNATVIELHLGVAH
ncbi:MAG TPA: hypothetical protein DDW52_29645, partial [Planctomycetaceae bacterium]|nr:hypothetical protein [Planctomycetaceae bacterium]